MMISTGRISLTLSWAPNLAVRRALSESGDILQIGKKLEEDAVLGHLPEGLRRRYSGRRLGQFGRTFDREGPGVAMFRAFVCLLGALLLQAFTRHGSVFYMSAALLGFGYGISAPVCQAMVNILVAPERRGAANATFMTAFDLGICIGIVAIGHVQKVLGWEASHAVEIACFIIGAALFWGLCLPHYTRTLKALREREVQAQQTQ